MIPRKLPALMGVLVLLMAGADRAAEPREAENSFRMKLVSKLETGTPEKMTKVDANTEIRYTWKVSGNERTLQYNALSVAVTVDGKENVNMEMSASKFMNYQNGQAIVADLSQQPAVKQMMVALFEKPLCVLTVDENGLETGRKVIADAAAQGIVENGGITNAVMLHRPYFAGKDKWEAPASIFVAAGAYAEGNLTYTRIADAKGLPTFSVSGTLGKDAIPQPGTPLVLKDVKDVVTGTQSYDPKLREWVAGAWKIQPSFTMTVKEKQVATAQGEMNVEFERVEPKPEGK